MPVKSRVCGPVRTPWSDRVSAVDILFHELRQAGRKAFIPFVTAGDPDLEFTSAVLRELDSRGSALCELGIPYSDPIADGPVIQASYTRALERRVRMAQIFEMAERVTPHLTAPVVVMVSYAIIHRFGPQRYVERARAAGIAGAIVPDLLVDEAEDMQRICAERDFSLIQLVTPTTPRERAMRIAATSTGFIYFVSITGITGERSQLPAELMDNVAWLREQTDVPVCIGFGISQPEHVSQLAPVADGLIVGSAIVRRIGELASKPRSAVLSDIGRYASSLISALDSVE